MESIKVTFMKINNWNWLDMIARLYFFFAHYVKKLIKVLDEKG